MRECFCDTPLGEPDPSEQILTYGKLISQIRREYRPLGRLLVSPRVIENPGLYRRNDGRERVELPGKLDSMVRFLMPPTLAQEFGVPVLSRGAFRIE